MARVAWVLIFLLMGCNTRSPIPTPEPSFVETPVNEATDKKQTSPEAPIGLKESGNVLVQGDQVVELYEVRGQSLRIGFQKKQDQLVAIHSTGKEKWRISTLGTPFGVFDFNRDGWPDLGLEFQKPSGEKCGDQDMLETWVEFVDGKSGMRYAPVAAMKSLCWDFGETKYPTHQLGRTTVMAGAGYLAVSPYYANTGWFLNFEGNAFSQLGAYYFPSTKFYDDTYTEAALNAYANGAKFVENSHVANGMIIEFEGQLRLVFFTSARVVQYKVGSMNEKQLIKDTPFLTADRKDLGGRNYGLVTLDPENRGFLALISGTSTYSFFQDMKAGERKTDEWANIERHVSLYSLKSGDVEDRFLSNAHDNDDGDKYENRIVHPDNPFIRTGKGRSRLAINVFRQGHWYLQISKPGSTDVEVELKDLFLWDIKDFDDDGVDEWIISPAKSGAVPSYFVRWETTIYHWNETTKAIVKIQTLNGGIPFLQRSANRSQHRTSTGYIFPVNYSKTNEGLKLILLSKENKVVTSPLNLK